MGDKNTHAKLLEACLLAATNQGSVVVVRALLSHPSCDLLARDEEGNTALHIAASRGHHEVVLELASRYSTPSKEACAGKNNKGQTPLHLACSKGWIRCVDPLAIKFRSELNVKDSRGNAPLMTGLLAGHDDIVSLLKQRYKMKLQLEDIKLPINQEQEENHKEKSEETNTNISKLSVTKASSCLLAAAKRGSLVVVRALLSHPSCDLLARDEEGNTALHIAASRGYHQVVLELASRYSTPSEEASAATNNDGQTPLHLACSKGWIKCVDPLAIKFPSYLNVKDSSGNVPLMTALLAGHDDIVSLLKQRYKMKLQSEDIKLAINEEKNEKVKSEEIKTDISITKESSCLLAAAKRGSVVVVRALLSHPSCDLLARDEEGNTALHIAASRGHHVVVLELASRYSMPTEEASAATNNDGQTPLHLACSKGWIRCVDPLAIKFPSELNVKDSSGNAPLMTALLAGHDDIVSLLKQRYKMKLQSEDIKLAINEDKNEKMKPEEINTDISKSITKESSCLLAAAKRGSLVVVRALLSHPSCDLLARDEEGNTALHIAASRGYHQVVLELASRYSMPTDEVPAATNNDGQTPLHLACSKGWIKCVDPLAIKFASYLNIKDSSGNVPLMTALLAGHDDIVSLLKQRYKVKFQSEDIKLAINEDKNEKMKPEEINTDISKSITKESSCLLAAAKRGSLVVVRALLSHPSCDLLARDEEGNTALHIAASRGYHQVVQELASRYSTTESSAMKNNEGQTSLHLASSKGYVECIRMLATRFPNELKVKNKYDNLPIHNAALFGHSNIIDCLCEEFGGDVDALGHLSRTCLLLACSGGNIKLTQKLFMKYNCRRDALDEAGRLATSCAAYYGHTYLLEMLINEFKFSPASTVRTDGQNLLHQACAGRHCKTASILISKYCIEPNVRDSHGYTALHCVCGPLFDTLKSVGNFHSPEDVEPTALLDMLVDLRCDPMDKDRIGRTALHHAVLSGQTQIVKQLVWKYKCCINSTDISGYTPLHYAAMGSYANATLVQVLLSKLGTNIKACYKQNQTLPAFHILVALLNGYCKVVTVLVEQFGCSPHIKGYNNRTSLHLASGGGHLELVEKLIDNYKCDPMARDDNGFTPLHIAALAGKEQVVKRLVGKYKCPVECRDNVDNTPLHIAAHECHMKVVQVLLSHLGADVHARNKKNDTALNLAARMGHSNIVTAFVEQFGCSPHIKGYSNRTSLHHASGGGHLELVEKLIDDYHCDPMARDDGGFTPLHIAALTGKKQIVKQLVCKYNCPVKCRDNYDNTPLHGAAQRGHLGVVQVLISELGADIHACNNENATALNVAALKGHSNVVTILVEQFGCSPHLKCYSNRTSLHHASEGGHLELVEKLIDDYHCDLMARDDDGLTPLHIAAAAGKEQVVRLLVSNYKCPVECRDNNDNTPLHLAARLGHMNVVEVLLSHLGADTHARNKQNQTALDKAIQNGSTNIVILLVEQFGCSPHTKSLKSQTPLHKACFVGHLELVEKLIDDYHCDPMARDDNGFTPLHIAAGSGKEQVVKRLVSNYKCPVGCRDINDNTPLHLAAQKGHLKVVQVLLSELGADIHICNKQNQTTLDAAILNGSTNIVILLVEQFGCSPHTKDLKSQTSLHNACFGSHLELVEKLIDDYHCDPMARDDDGLTPLHIAAAAGKGKVVKRLVSNYKCLVECRDNNDNTPLHLAAYEGHMNVVSVLLSHLGADVHARNKQNATALNLAAQMGHSNVVTLLVEQFGCSPHTKGYNNKTLLHYACDGSHLELVEKLIDDYHCDPMARDDNGFTPLHIAAGSGKEQVVKLLVSNYKCPVECRDNNDNTPLHLAARLGHMNVVEVLLSELGADVHARNKQNATALHVAALNGHNNVVTLLVEQFGCSPHTKGYNNRTTVHDASEGGHLELVEKLIDDYHCDLMARDDNGLIPLHIAALKGKEQVVKRLVGKYNCPVGCRDSDGNTPLHLAAENGHLNVVQALLSELGGDVQIYNKQNNTPLNVAALMGHSNVVTLLIEQFGCIPHTKGFNNRTPLHDACLGGHLELVEKLIDNYRCDPMARDDEGLTPLHIAAFKVNEAIISKFVLKYNCSQYVSDNDGNTLLHSFELLSSGDMGCLKFLVDVIGTFPSIKNNKGKLPIDKERLELLVIPNMNNSVRYLSKHAVGEYRHAPPKLLVFDKRIVSTLNDNSKYSLLSSPYAQSCGLCYMDSVVNDLWVCQVGPEIQHTSVLQSLASGPILMVVATVNLSIPIDQAMSDACSQVALAKKLAYQDQSSSIPVRLLLTGNSSPEKKNMFDAVCQKIVDKHSIYFAQHFLSCASDKFPQKIFPIISEFINTSLGTVPNPDVPEITHGSIYLLKFLYQVYPGKFYAKFSQLAKQLENRRIMTEDHPEEIHACLRQLDKQGYLLTTGTSDHPQYIILNPLHMLHTLEEFSHKTSDPLATLGLYSKSLLSCVFPDCEFSMIESFLSKLGLSSEVSDRIVDLVMKQDLSTHVADKCFYIPQLATTARQLNCWTCQPETVFSCGLHVIALRKSNSFPTRLMNDVLLQTMRLITRNFLIEPHGLMDCTLWKGGIHWMVENVEVLVEFVDDVGGIVVMGRSDVCNMLKCVDMFVKVVDMVLEVKRICCGDILHKINVLDPIALESNSIPYGNVNLWCDIITAARAIRTGRKNIQSTCRIQQFSVEKLNWLTKFSLQGMSNI